LRKRIPGLAELVVELRHSVERDLDAEELERGLLQDIANRVDRPLGKIGIRRNVYFLHAVVADELAADRGELLAQKRLATGEIEVFDWTNSSERATSSSSVRSSGWLSSFQ
jgi:hypothetical protein